MSALVVQASQLRWGDVVIEDDPPRTVASARTRGSVTVVAFTNGESHRCAARALVHVERGRSKELRVV